MDFSSLSSGIITAILDLAYPEYSDEYWLWSPSLPLAQVCRSWREHLLPKLHQTAYVVTTSDIESTSKSCAYRFNGTLNATLSLGYGHYVKNIVIMDSYYAPLSQIKTSSPETWTAFNFPDNMWPGLSQLQVNAYACTIPDDQKILYFQSIPEPSSNFSKLLPNVASFKFKFSSDDYFTSALKYRVVDACNVLVDGASLSNESQTFCLYLDSYDQISAHYSTESIPIESLSTLTSLDHLAFIDIPRSTPWFCPIGFTTSNPIVNLDNLKYLRLEFRDIPLGCGLDVTSEKLLNKLTPPYQLHFPNLQKLALRNCLYDFSFFAYLDRSLPQMIQHVIITGNIEEVFPVFTVLPRICNLNVELWEKDAPEDFDKHLFLDTAFGSQSMAEFATFKCNAEHLPVCLDNSLWPKLVDLTIYSAMSIDCIFGLLNCLPKLEIFKIAWISDSDSDNLTEADWDKMPVLEPLKTKVCHLEVGDGKYANIEKFPVANTLYLTARLANLQTIVIKHETPVETLHFTSVLHKKYSHTIGISTSFEHISYYSMEMKPVTSTRFPPLDDNLDN